MEKILLFLAFEFLLFISSNAQNVGIGTTTPNAPLQFANTGANRKIVLWETANNDHQFYGFGINGFTLRYQTPSVTDDHVFYAGAGTNASQELIRIKGNGNVGIGTNLPVNKLTVNGNADINGKVGIGITTPNAPLQFANIASNRKIVLWESSNNENQYYGFGINAGVLRYQTNALASDHVFYAAADANTSQELMRIKGNGNVGIGTSLPTYKLHVNNSNNSLRIEGPPASLSSGNAISVGGNGDIQIDKPGVAGGRFTIKENGNVGINNNNPATKLDVNGDINFNGPLMINGNSGSTGQLLQSNGSAAPKWLTKPYFLKFSGSLSHTLLEGFNVEAINIPGLDNLSFFIPEPCRALVSIHAELGSINSLAGGTASGDFNFTLIESSTNITKLDLKAGGYASSDFTTLHNQDIVDLNPGFYQIKARHRRFHHIMSGDSELYHPYIIIQVFPF